MNTVFNISLVEMCNLIDNDQILQLFYIPAVHLWFMKVINKSSKK